MSKQTTSRPGQNAPRPAGERPSKSAQGAKSGAKPGARPSGNTNRPAGMTAQQRIQAQQAAARNKQAGGFKLRPFDVALLGITAIVIAFVVWSITSGANKSSPATQPNVPTADTTPLPVGAVAPDFKFPAADGKEYALSDFKGKVVLAEFFAPWCPHCRDDAPMFNQVAEKFKGQDVQVLAIRASPDNKDRNGPISMNDITWFRDTYKVTFPMLFDKDLTATKDYGIMFYPTVYMIDKTGKIASQPAGYFTWENGKPVSKREQELTADNLSKEIERLLK